MAPGVVARVGEGAGRPGRRDRRLPGGPRRARAGEAGEASARPLVARLPVAAWRTDARRPGPAAERLAYALRGGSGPQNVAAGLGLPLPRPRKVSGHPWRGSRRWSPRHRPTSPDRAGPADPAPGRGGWPRVRCGAVGPRATLGRTYRGTRRGGGMADASDSKSDGATRAGSNPAPGTTTSPRTNKHTTPAEPAGRRAPSVPCHSLRVKGFPCPSVGVRGCPWVSVHGRGTIGAHCGAHGLCLEVHGP